MGVSPGYRMPSPLRGLEVVVPRTPGLRPGLHALAPPGPSDEHHPLRGVRFSSARPCRVVLLRDAFRMKTATLAMVQEVAEFVRRVLYDPALRFEARSWEE
jgi:hypothetical protein